MVISYICIYYINAPNVPKLTRKKSNVWKKQTENKYQMMWGMDEGNDHCEPNKFM